MQQDEEQMIRGVDWRKALPFTHLFRAFRVAIHPYKLLLGLAMIAMVVVGGWALDKVWLSHDKAVDDEVTLYATSGTRQEFDWERDARQPATTGLFRTFVKYEATHFNGLIISVARNQWFRTEAQVGVVGNVYHIAVTGPSWLARIHPIFCAMLAMLFLISWSLFGGAIARLAAVNVARDEKVSIRQALGFSLGKFFSFASAPIIMILIVVVIGVALSLGGLLGNIPFFGPIIIGGFFFVALLAAFIQTLLILATVGGFNLMYPTVAVEGSDSFDAISRSFSYVFARPWRMLFYTGISVAYGAITYLFVRLFVLMMLVLAHHFVGIGIFVKDPQGVGLFPAMWPSPAEAGRLAYRPDFAHLNFGGKIGSLMLMGWVYLIVALVGAYVISFYFTANTIIYLLIRRELDATEMDEVYLEETEEDYAPVGEGEPDASPVPPAPPPPAAALPPASPAAPNPGVT